jgi:molybdopterin molybdotransferase
VSNGAGGGGFIFAKSPPSSKIRDVRQTNAEAQALEWEDARSIVIETMRGVVSPPQVETVPLAQAHGRVLATDIKADRDYPPIARSLRDGFAIHAADVPGTLSIIGETRAGESQQAALARGYAVEIMTGAPLPAGADAVVMVEHVERVGETVTISQSARAGQFINRQGAEAQAQATLIPKGIRLDASHIGTLAMTGHSAAIVYRKPSVAILSTGDELVEVGATPAPHQIRNSNSYSLAALVMGAGGKAVILPVARDTEPELLLSLEQGLRYDLLLVSGGVSAGKYDLVKPCLRGLGAEFLFERVNIQPGRPVAFGRVENRFVFGLPGNPGSSMVTFLLFAKAALELLSGLREPLLPIAEARFEDPFEHRSGLTRFLPACLGDNGTLRHVPWQGSSDLPALARANVFLIADHNRDSWAAGDAIRVLLKP